MVPPAAGREPGAIIFFQPEQALDAFKKGQLALAAQVSGDGTEP